MASNSKEDAVALKEKGNQAFKGHDWPTAVKYYTEAIEAYGSEPSFYTNRAQVPFTSKTASTRPLLK
jgi:serine/threonine-protein phosphatase 5